MAEFIDETLTEIVGLKSNWLVLSPTWTALDNDPTSLQMIAGEDATWPDLLSQAQLAQQQGLQVALFPHLSFPDGYDDWWIDAPRDFSWWVTWWDRFETYMLHHAELATETNATALVIGGRDVSPALPEGVLPDGSLSGVPGDTTQRWRDLMPRSVRFIPVPFIGACS